MTSSTFAELGVRPETVAALAEIGITHAFAIQEYALPIAARGADLIGQAPTGTGKTFGFGLPLVDRAVTPAEGGDGLPAALVVVPTRELGLQVAKDLQAAGKLRGVRVLPIYGGVGYEPQIDALTKGVEILVATPGRLLDLIKQKHLKLDRIKAIVLDEADRMLDLGFLDDVEKILAMLPEQRQTMLFSATMPDAIVTLSRRFLHSPITVHAGHTEETGVSPQTKQFVYRTHSLNKLEMLARILQVTDRGLTMIFSRTKRNCDRVTEDLDFRGFAAAAVHGDLNQGARERALRAFRAGKIDVLVATDVAARGIDITGVTHVINFDCPEDPDTYVHRIGRTGRAGATGVAVTFVDWEDMPRWRIIDKTLEIGNPDPVETYHTSPWLYTDLDIPTEAAASLPSAQRSRVGLSAEVEEDLGGRPKRGESERGRRPADGERGGRSRGRSGRSGGDAATPAAEGDTTTEPKQPRQRRRSRAGSIVKGDPTVVLFSSADDGADTAVITESAVDGAGPDEATGRPRRRRRRGGRGRTPGAEGTAGTDTVEAAGGDE
ncbi:superfamily II DNA/RNA helicase [Allocatelliglobosispora scoriae]|uniref:Superfamily II DNA/RNA helicase n=1 Tax=Allocatelliglobosispora scoriae TaxID=643052 RepID=A0A841BT31_9ACTN|nr:DEAD/DEAH box helicase [Allocatelliglobosispora scoriae]MBB5871374.1 superfamily II DNA/RNA helicase [Allocatelliglobosispora scoriae]